MTAMEFAVILGGILLGMLLTPLWNSTVGTYVTALKAS
jgi:hypothetical protein